MRLLNKKFARKTAAAALVLATAATLATGAFAAEDDGGRGIGAVLAGHDGRRGLCESAMPWLASYV